MAKTTKELFAELEPEEQSTQELFRALEPEAEHPWWTFAKREWGKEVEALKSTPENLAQSIEWGVRQFDPENLKAFPSNLGDLWMWVARQMPEQQDFPESWAEASTYQKGVAGAQVVSLAGLITILTSQGLTAVNAARTAYRMWRNTKNIEKAEDLAKKGLFERVEAVTGKKPYIKVETFKGKAPAFGGKIVERGGVERGRLPLAPTKRVVESGWTAPKEPVGGPGIPEAVKSITGVRARAAAEFAKNIPAHTQTMGKNWMGDELERIGLSVVEKIAPKAQFNEVLTATQRALTPLIKDLPAKVKVGAAETIANQFFQALVPMANQLATGIEPTALKPEAPPPTTTEEVTAVEPLAEAPSEEIPPELILAMKDTTTGEITTATEGEYIHPDMMARLGERYGDMEPGWVGSGGKFYNAFEVRRGLGRADPIKAGVPPEVPPVGFKPPVPPTPPPAGMPQEPQYDPVVKLNALIKQAKPLRKEIETAYTKERAARFAQVAEYIDTQVDTVGGIEGYEAITSKMGGPLISEEERKKLKISFEPVQDKLTEEDIKGLFARTWHHLYLSEGEKLSAGSGLKGLLEGAIPQPHQLVLLEEIYGSELIKELLTKRAWGLRGRDFALEIANIPRAMLATADMSAFLRQGIIELAAHPIITGKAMAKTFQFAFDPKAYDGYFDDLPKTAGGRYNPARYSLARRADLAIRDPRMITTGVGEREEPFISRILQRTPGIKIPVGFAERAYTGFLAKVRMDVFNLWADEFIGQGFDPEATEKYKPEDFKVFKSAATVINAFTGRGSLGEKLNRVAPELNTILFSPRLISARFNALNPVWYAKQPKPVRKKALADFAKFVAAGTTTLALIKVLAEDEDDITVETDPRSSDFGKIKVGNTRYDIWGGFQQWARVFSQIGSGERKVTTTGEIISLNKEEYPFTTRKEVFLRFAEGKLAPGPALVNELMSGAKTFEGDPMTLQSVIYSKFMPMVIQDIAEAYEEGGFERAFPAGTAAFFGVGVQTYGPRPKKARKPYWFEEN